MGGRVVGHSDAPPGWLDTPVSSAGGWTLRFAGLFFLAPGAGGVDSCRGIIERMWPRRRRTLDLLIRDVRDGLRHRREDGRRVLPSHREDEREGDQLLFPRLRREGNAKLGDVVDVEIDAVEAVTQIDLHHLDGAVSRVGQEDLAQEAVEGVTELHCLDGGEQQRLLIHF